MRRQTTLLLAMLAVAGTTAVARPAAAATTITVNNGSGGDTTGSCSSPDYTSISDALVAASDGDTIHVCAGVYHESISDLGHSITFEGAQAGHDARTRSGAETVLDGGGSSIVTLFGQSVLDGFTLHGADDDANAYGVQLNSLEQVVRNDIFSDDGTPVEVLGRHDLVDQSSVSSPVAGGGAGVEIAANNGEDDSVTNSAFSGTFPAAAISIPGYGGITSALAVSGNTASVTGGHFLAATNTTGLAVSDNIVTGTATAADAVALGAAVFDFTVSGNHVSGFSDAAAVGVDDALDWRYSFAQNGSISRNDFRGNARGIRVGEQHGTLTATGNVLAGNSSAAIDDESADATVQAPENFYGCNTGPNTSGCDAVSGLAAPTSWLVLSPPGLGDAAAPTTVSAGQHYTFTADLLHDNTGALAGADALVPDGVPVTFAFDRGSVAPATGVFSSGSATTSYTPAASAGPGRVTGSLGNAQAYQDVVVDAPAPAVPAVRIAGASVREGNSGYRVLAFAVTLDHASTVPVSVRYVTENGTAKAPSDYIATRGTLTIPAGQTRRYVYVVTRGDRQKERTESFLVRLSNPVHARIATATALGTIVNDD